MIVIHHLFSPQSISAPGSGIWSDGKDKSDGSQPHTWNVEVLIDVVKELVSPVRCPFVQTIKFKGEIYSSNIHRWFLLIAGSVLCQNPNLNFKEVTYELDHAGFMIRDSKGLQIVVYGIQRGLGMEVFPVDLIYRPWKHAEGQVKEHDPLKVHV